MPRLRIPANARLIDPSTGFLTREGKQAFDFITDAVNGSGDVIVSTGDQTLTGKRIDGDDNTIVNIATASLKKPSGNSDTVATGNGTPGTIAQWGTTGNLETGPSSSLVLTQPTGDNRYILQDGSTAMSGVLRLASYTVAGVPSAAAFTGAVIFVSNESGGATMAISDGTNWLRMQDRAIIS